jgi:hypothetical protein
MNHMHPKAMHAVLESRIRMVALPLDPEWKWGRLLLY